MGTRWATLSKPSAGDELSREEEQEVRELRARDAEVRAHENAHKAAAGRHSRGGPSYEYERGPDGRQYAVGGEVSIDSSPVAGDPDATVDEVGDLLFAVVNVARHLRVDPESALRRASQKFRRRFELVEELARDRSIELERADLTTLDGLWDEAKSGTGKSTDDLGSASD